MRMRSQMDMRSMLSKAALKSTNAMYNVRLCSLHFSIICRRANIWSMVERPGMKPACCIRLRDLIAETDLRRRVSARSFPGIDKRVIPRWFAQIRRSPFRSSAVTLHIPAALSFFSDFTAFRTSSSVTSSSDIDRSVGAFAAAVDVSELCGTGSLFNQARIQLLAKGEVVKIMENNVLLPQAANVSDRMPRKRVPQPARMSFSVYNRQ